MARQRELVELSIAYPPFETFLPAPRIILAAPVHVSNVSDLLRYFEKLGITARYDTQRRAIVFWENGQEKTAFVGKHYIVLIDGQVDVMRKETFNRKFIPVKCLV